MKNQHIPKQHLLQNSIYLFSPGAKIFFVGYKKIQEVFLSLTNVPAGAVEPQFWER
jgi:hypothetical protein